MTLVPAENVEPILAGGDEVGAAAGAEAKETG